MKKITCTLAAVVAVLAFTACGNTHMEGSGTLVTAAPMTGTAKVDGAMEANGTLVLNVMTGSAVAR